MTDHKRIERIKKQYPEGTRICLDHMGDDPHPVPNGTKGTVAHVDDIGTIFCKFDNGRFMGIVPDKDRFHVIEQEENISEDEKEDENMEEDTSMTMNMGV